MTDRGRVHRNCDSNRTVFFRLANANLYSNVHSASQLLSDIRTTRVHRSSLAPLRYGENTNSMSHHEPAPGEIVAIDN